LTTNGEPKEFFFSSDGCATVKHTKNYLAVEDDETVLVMVFFKLLAFFVSEGSSNLI
jgi:glucosamine 6-phosphate synthetase-like amidotransferase/phosphosugar isomerase protein